MSKVKDLILTKEEIKLINESNSGDLGPCDSVDSKILSKVQKRKVCPECEHEDCICGMDESDDLEDLSLDKYTAQEIEEVLRDLAPDELEYVKIIINDNLEDFCEEFKSVYNKDLNIEELVRIVYECCPEDLELLGDCVFYVLDDIDDFSDFAYGDGELGERLINPQHIRRLKLAKRKASWKAEARKRKRFRRTGEGRIMKRKAKLYMKRYRRRKKMRLKRYGKEYGKFMKTAHFAK